MGVHEGRVPATGERRYIVGWCDGALIVDDDRLTLQGAPHDNGRLRDPVVIERADVRRIILRCGLFGAAVQRETPAGFRSPLVRVRDPRPLLTDLVAHGWPARATGWRRPRS